MWYGAHIYRLQESATLMPSLASVRRRRLLTQRALANKAGVALSTVYAIENGRRAVPRFEVIRKLAEALEIEPLEIDEFRHAIGDEASRRTAAAA